MVQVFPLFHLCGCHKPWLVLEQIFAIFLVAIKNILFLDSPVPNENVSLLVGGQHFSGRNCMSTSRVWHHFRRKFLSRRTNQEALLQDTSLQHADCRYLSLPRFFHQSYYLTSLEHSKSCFLSLHHSLNISQRKDNS